MKKWSWLMLLALPVLPVHAAGLGGMFGEGSTQFSLMAGNAFAFNKNYLVIGGSASYYLADGLGVGLSLESWSGNTPGITKYAPFVQYVFYRVPGTQPYVGGFYRHTSIAGLPGINSVGARVGVLFASGRKAFFSVGLVQETYLNCRESLYTVCNETYPELSLIFGF